MTEAAGPAATQAHRRAVIRRLVVVLAVVAAGVVLVVTIGISRPSADDDPQAAPLPEPNSGAPDGGFPAPVDRPDASDAAELAQWSTRVEAQTGIPARVLRAYGLAEMWMRSESPDCRLSWPTLAGIGAITTDHGRRAGSNVNADGVAVLRIVGKPLDGRAGRPRVADTDHGRLDGDRKWDRRLGPMHLRPESWTAWRVRAAKDRGEPDPQNVDDAAVAAARELCDRGRDLSGRTGWWPGVRSYGGSVRFAQHTFAAAQAYAEQSEAAGS